MVVCVWAWDVERVTISSMGVLSFRCHSIKVCVHADCMGELPQARHQPDFPYVPTETLKHLKN